MYAEVSGDRIWLTTEFRQAELVKRVPGRKWDKDYRMWWVPLSWAACCSLRGVFGEEMDIGPELTAWAVRELSERVTPCMALRDAEDADIPREIIPTTLPKKGEIFNGEVVEKDWDLEPRQRAGIAFLATAERACCADEMGSGKSVMTVMTLELLSHQGKDPYPAVIVCPNSMKETWAKEFRMWAPHRDVAVVTGGAAARRKIIGANHEVLVINWEALRAHTRVAGYGSIRLTDEEKVPKDLNDIGIRTFVGDECHRAKNPKAKQTRAAWWLSWEAEFRFGDTGTPLANTPEDTWSIMHMLEPKEWPSKSSFLDRFALLSWSPFGHMDVVGVKGETREEFFKILDPRFIRRPTKIVIPGLKDKLPLQVREVELPVKQRRAYDQLRKDMLAELDSGILMATNPLTRMIRLLQLASAYGEVDEAGGMTLSEPSIKLDAFDDVLTEIGPNEPVVVFAESRQLIELAAARWTKEKRSYGLITGAVDPHQRQSYVDEFQNGRLDIMGCTLGAGGEGITLTRARFIVYLQRSFSLIKNTQSEARVWRKGQDREVQRIDIVAKDTIEQHVLDIGDEKEDRLEEICRDQDTLRRWLEP